MKTQKRALFAALAAVVALGFAGLGAPAFAYPDKPVIFVVPYGPGGPSDLAARTMQPYFKKVTGQELVIQNKPGAGGATAWSQLNGMEADGYTVMLTALPHIILQPVVNKPSGYETEDIANLLAYAYLAQVIGVARDSKYKTTAQLVDAAKKKPGGITIAGTGIGTGNHAGYALFDKVAGIKTAYVPFKDTASTNAATMGNQVDASWTWLSSGITKKDRLRMLAIAGEKRFPAFPEVPTLKEIGYDLTIGAWIMLAVPKGVPEDMRKTVSEVFARVIADKEYQAKMAKFGYVPMSITYPQVKKFVAEKSKVFRPLAATLKKK